MEIVEEQGVMIQKTYLRPIVFTVSNIGLFTIMR
jgi:hypothetical protein